MMPALAHTPVLETDRMILRAPLGSDLAAFTDYATGSRTRFVGGPRSAAQAAEKFAGMIGQWVMRGFGRLIMTLRATNLPIGHVGPLQMDSTKPTELTWSIWDSAYEGQRLTLEAARAMRDWVFGPLGLTHATTIIHRDNTASHRIATHLGGTARAPEPTALGPDFVTYDFRGAQP
jgi:RimJ/RimL family protein N-acetyltransferase